MYLADELGHATGCRFYNTARESNAIDRIAIFTGPASAGFPQVAIQFKDQGGDYLFKVNEHELTQLEAAAKDPSRSLGKTFQGLNRRGSHHAYFDSPMIWNAINELSRDPEVLEKALAEAPHLLGDPDGAVVRVPQAA